ncbi:MAG: hypothetical protein R3F54_17330 [Alphaproteobacteria bacterium]
MTGHDVFLDEIHANLPRLLGAFDVNPASSSLGCGDRFHWAWKLIDFPNATFQGAVHGLAILAAGDMLPAGIDQAAIVERCSHMIDGLARMTRADGSLEEAFPHEASFCVTSLVAHDVLAALDRLEAYLPDAERARWLAAAAPLIAHTIRSDETHGLISNHLATAAAALFRWCALARGSVEAERTASPAAAEDKGQRLVERILAHQSPEGWFSEYGGADPGYQTLCTDYLAWLHRTRPDLELRAPLQRSLRFLSHFAHPDRSFAGVYGHRNTRVYQPGGIAELAGEFPEAAALTRFMLTGIAERTCVGLSAIDAPNLVPMFNSYCKAAAAMRDLNPALGSAPPLPCQRAGAFQERFDHAGLIVDKRATGYTVINWKKGGTVASYRLDGRAAHIDAGVLARTAKGRLVSTQGPGGVLEAAVDGDRVVVRAPFTEVLDRRPGPFDFLLLRAACLTVMRFAPTRAWIKRALVRLLMTKARPVAAWNRRTITLAPALTVSDAQQGEAALEVVPAARGFVAIHGATQGYWQRGDDAPIDGGAHNAVGVVERGGIGERGAA